jgi:hypothetical protein
MMLFDGSINKFAIKKIMVSSQIAVAPLLTIYSKKLNDQNIAI